MYLIDKRTSPDSSLVRIAARSPALSSAGPDVLCIATPISPATILANVVFLIREVRQTVDDLRAFLASGLLQE